MIPVIGEVCDVISGVISAAKGDWAGAALSIASAIPVVGNLAGAAKIAKGMVKLVDKVTGASKTIDKAVALGKIGEKTSGLIKNTERITSLTKTAKYRIPDGLNNAKKVLSEVKNVKYQSYTNQIQDFMMYSRQRGFAFELWTRSDTAFSNTIQELIDNGDIIHRILP